jgi:DNA-binding response OmpR family regulator
MLRDVGEGMAQRVLIVDDNEDVRRILGLRLQSAGFDVEEAADGAQGLEAVRRTPIDLVLLDLFMPGMDGFRFLEELRSNVPAQPPVVVVTQYDDVDNRNRALSLGASEYVSKGYAFERAFVGMIRKYLAVGERGQ